MAQAEVRVRKNRVRHPGKIERCAKSNALGRPFFVLLTTSKEP